MSLQNEQENINPMPRHADLNTSGCGQQSVQYENLRCGKKVMQKLAQPIVSLPSQALFATPHTRKGTELL